VSFFSDTFLQWNWSDTSEFVVFWFWRMCDLVRYQGGLSVDASAFDARYHDLLIGARQQLEALPIHDADLFSLVVPFITNMFVRLFVLRIKRCKTRVAVKLGILNEKTRKRFRSFFCETPITFRTQALFKDLIPTRWLHSLKWCLLRSPLIENKHLVEYFNLLVLVAQHLTESLCVSLLKPRLVQLLDRFGESTELTMEILRPQTAVFVLPPHATMCQVAKSVCGISFIKDKFGEQIFARHYLKVVRKCLRSPNQSVCVCVWSFVWGINCHFEFCPRSEQAVARRIKVVSKSLLEKHLESP